MLDPEIYPFPAGSGQEPRIEDVLYEVVVEFCPIGHPWGPPATIGPGYNIYAGTQANRLQLFINRLIGRRMYRQQMLALLDRHCAIGQSVDSSAAPQPDASDTAR